MTEVKITQRILPRVAHFYVDGFGWVDRIGNAGRNFGGNPLTIERIAISHIKDVQRPARIQFVIACQCYKIIWRAVRCMAGSNDHLWRTNRIAQAQRRGDRNSVEFELIGARSFKLLNVGRIGARPLCALIGGTGYPRSIKRMSIGVTSR